MTKGIVRTVDDAVDRCYGIQVKAYWLPLERQWHKKWFEDTYKFQEETKCLLRTYKATRDKKLRGVVEERRLVVENKIKIFLKTISEFGRDQFVFTVDYDARRMRMKRKKVLPMC